MRLANDSPSFTPVHPQIREIGPQDLHLAKGRGRCPKIVLWDVLLELDLVLLDKIGVIGLLKCLSLSLKSRQSRQVLAGAMSPLVTPSF
jgi:hypothetical protein